MGMFSWLIKPVEASVPTPKPKVVRVKAPEKLVTKFCNRCKRDKPCSDYNRLTKAPDGLQANCRECQAAMTARWYAKKKQVNALEARRIEAQKLREATGVQSVAIHSVPKSVVVRLKRIAEQRKKTLNQLGLEALNAFLTLSE